MSLPDLSAAAAPSPGHDEEERRGWDTSTLCLHADARHAVEGDTAVMPSISVTTTFVRPPSPSSPGPRAPDAPYVYSRVDQPTRRRVEAVLGELEGGTALTYASGLAAIAAVLHHVKPHRTVASLGYFASRALLSAYRSYAGAGEAPDVLPGADLSTEEGRRATARVLRGADLVLVETPRNPDAALVDVEALAPLCREAGAVLVVDSTFASPVLCRPLALGATIVMHSATKVLGGHSDLLCGVLVAADPGRAARLAEERTFSGAVPGSLEAWLLLRSLRTLPLRVARHSASALRVAQWLEGSPHVAAVHQPFLESSPQHALARRLLSAAPSCFAFETRTARVARKLGRRCRIFADATSLGGAESLLDYRYRWDQTLSPRLLRISVGLEDPDDLCRDLEQALEALATEAGEEEEEDEE